MGAIGNLVWFIFGGGFMGFLWCIAGLLMYISVIGIPWGKACFVIGGFAFFPFGKEAINREKLTGQNDIGTGGLGIIGNIIWFIFAGLWLALGHFFTAIVYVCTIIGIPFAVQHFKLAGIALSPIGKTIVTKEVAQLAINQNAANTLNKLRYDSKKELIENN